MPEYCCITCNFKTKIKTHYERHNKSKRHNDFIQRDIKPKSEKSLVIEPDMTYYL